MLCGFDGVVEEHCDCHRADAAGDGGYEGGLFFYVLEIHVADETIAGFFGGVLNAINADVDDYRAIFNHIGGDGIWIAGGGDDDIGSFRVVGEIFCASVADGYGGVAEGAFLDEYIGKGFTDDIASADDDDVCAFDFDAAFNAEAGRRREGCRAETPFGPLPFCLRLSGESRRHLWRGRLPEALPIHRYVSAEATGQDAVDFRVFVQPIDNATLTLFAKLTRSRRLSSEYMPISSQAFCFAVT